MVPPTVGPVLEWKARMKIFRREQEKDVMILGNIIAILCKEKEKQNEKWLLTLWTFMVGVGEHEIIIYSRERRENGGEVLEEN